MTQDKLLDEKIATVRAIVDRLVSVCSGFESDEWMAKFLAVQQALSEGRLKDAVREEAKLTCYVVRPKWVVSQELERTLETAMGVMHRQLQFPDHVEARFVIGNLPTDVTVRGTLEEREKLALIGLAKSIKVDPLEENPEYTEILADASRRAVKELEIDGLTDGFGYCQFLWRKKQEILRRDHGLEWRTPAEMNPHIHFD